MILSNLYSVLDHCFQFQILIQQYHMTQEEAAARALGYTHHPPKLWLDPGVTDFYAFTTDHLRLEGYQCHELGEKIPVAI